MQIESTTQMRMEVSLGRVGPAVVPQNGAICGAHDSRSASHGTSQHTTTNDKRATPAINAPPRVVQNGHVDSAASQHRRAHEFDVRCVLDAPGPAPKPYTLYDCPVSCCWPPCGSCSGLAMDELDGRCPYGSSWLGAPGVVAMPGYAPGMYAEKSQDSRPVCGSAGE